MTLQGRLSKALLLLLLQPIITACNNRHQEQSQPAESGSRSGSASAPSKDRAEATQPETASALSQRIGSSQLAAKEILDDVRHCAGMSAIAFAASSTEGYRAISHKWAWSAYLVGRLSGISHDESYSAVLHSSEKYALAVTGTEAQKKASRKLILTLPEESALCEKRSATNSILRQASKAAEEILKHENDEATLQRIALEFVSTIESPN